MFEKLLAANSDFSILDRKKYENPMFRFVMSSIIVQLLFSHYDNDTDFVYHC